MVRLALVGKSIAHSKSKFAYESILGQKVYYELIDIDSLDLMPKLLDLKNEFTGLSVTSPYKRSFFHLLAQEQNVEFLPEAKVSNCVNCIGFQNGRIEATNTDYLALKVILEEYLAKTGPYHIYLLGDGAMSYVIQCCANALGIPYTVFSRKLNRNFSHLDLKCFAKDLKSTVFVINTCSRDFLFHGTLPQNCDLLDLNYQSLAFKNNLRSKPNSFVDGTRALIYQAYFALNFWGLLQDQLNYSTSN